MRKFVVAYQVATYSGEIDVYFNDDEDPETEEVLGKAKRQLTRNSGPLPFGYQRFKIIDSE